MRVHLEYHEADRRCGGRQVYRGRSPAFGRQPHPSHLLLFPVLFYFIESMLGNDLKRPLVLARKSSVRSCSSMSTSSRRSSATWDRDASVRLFIDRTREATPCDEDLYLTGSEPDSQSGWTSPVLSDYTPSLPASSSTNHSTLPPSPVTFRNPFLNPDTSTSALVAAAREASQALTLSTQAPDPYPYNDVQEHFVGFGKLPQKEIMFRRPVRAAKNRWAPSTRRYVDILT
ncbi:hypothetical protein BDV93DRAFT_611142 [Ceratobasidium sp. AG-I]|nr:hypothetical protein BDV93DRAFT_611142 [Ceratobasidium sp. AG-I]